MQKNTRTIVLPCVLTVLESALRERLIFSPKSIPNYKREIFIDTVSKIIEKQIYRTSMPYESNITEHRHMERIQWESLDSDKRTSNEEATFMPYITMIAKMTIHISPAFYTGRHSFYFRDKILKKEISGITEIDVEELWPEIYANDLFDKKEYSQVTTTRDVEINIAIKGILSLIEKCCNSSSSDKVCSTDERLITLKNGGIFEEGSEFSKSKQIICFGKGDTCSVPDSNKIVLPCSSSDVTCPVIPEKAKIIGKWIDDSKYFTSCTMYEDFLRQFATDDMQAEITDPFGIEENMSSEAVKKIRRKYSKELKMMRVYLDILNAD